MCKIDGNKKAQKTKQKIIFNKIKKLLGNIIFVD